MISVSWAAEALETTVALIFPLNLFCASQLTLVSKSPAFKGFSPGAASKEDSTWPSFTSTSLPSMETASLVGTWIAMDSFSATVTVALEPVTSTVRSIPSVLTRVMEAFSCSVDSDCSSIVKTPASDVDSLTSKIAFSSEEFTFV